MRLARAARRYSSHAPLAPRFATTLNYTTSDIIQLAQSDEAAAVRGFWQPLRDYRSLMHSLSERHAREELGLGSEAALAAAMRAESVDQRRTRLASFGSFMAALTTNGDEEAAAAASAAAAWAAADLMAAVIAASSLGAGALLLARMAGAASR